MCPASFGFSIMPCKTWRPGFFFMIGPAFQVSSLAEPYLPNLLVTYGVVGYKEYLKRGSTKFRKIYIPSFLHAMILRSPSVLLYYRGAYCQCIRYGSLLLGAAGSHCTLYHKTSAGFCCSIIAHLLSYYVRYGILFIRILPVPFLTLQ